MCPSIDCGPVIHACVEGCGGSRDRDRCSRRVGHNLTFGCPWDRQSFVSHGRKKPFLLPVTCVCAGPRVEALKVRTGGDPIHAAQCSTVIHPGAAANRVRGILVDRRGIGDGCGYKDCGRLAPRTTRVPPWLTCSRSSMCERGANRIRIAGIEHRICQRRCTGVEWQPVPTHRSAGCAWSTANCAIIEESMTRSRVGQAANEQVADMASAGSGLDCIAAYQRNGASAPDAAGCASGTSRFNKGDHGANRSHGSMPISILFRST